MGAQKDHRAPAAWPRPKRSDAVLLLVLCAFGIAAKVVMTGLDALTGEFLDQIRNRPAVST